MNFQFKLVVPWFFQLM